MNEWLKPFDVSRFLPNSFEIGQYKGNQSSTSTNQTDSKSPSPLQNELCSKPKDDLEKLSNKKTCPVGTILNVDVYGYKAFDKNLKCRDYQYEIGAIATLPSWRVTPGSVGFHFCRNAQDVMSFYSVSESSSNRFCLVKAPASSILYEMDRQSMTNCLEIVRELHPEEVNTLIRTVHNKCL